MPVEYQAKYLNYQPDNFHGSTDVGTLNVECLYCGAFKFPGETESFCCANGGRAKRLDWTLDSKVNYGHQ